MEEVKELTYQEKYDMYMKLSKDELAKMLIASNETLSSVLKNQGFSQPYVIQHPVDNGPCINGAPCNNPFHDCINCPSRFSSSSYKTTTNYTYTSTDEIKDR